MSSGPNPCYYWRLASQLPHTWPQKQNPAPSINYTLSDALFYLVPLLNVPITIAAAVSPFSFYLAATLRFGFFLCGTWLLKPRLALHQLWVWPIFEVNSLGGATRQSIWLLFATAIIKERVSLFLFSLSLSAFSHVFVSWQQGTLALYATALVLGVISCFVESFRKLDGCECSWNGPRVCIPLQLVVLFWLALPQKQENLLLGNGPRKSRK